MIDLEFVESLIRALDESTLDSLEIERGGTRVRLSKSAPPASESVEAAAAPAPVVGSEAGAEAPEEAPVAEPSNLVDVTSPMVGTFYRAPSPDAPPYVQVGSRVTEGEPLCIIEAMKLMNELEAEVAGRIAEICVENADPVEYGQVLFRVEPS